jgi:hypothetical protein
MSCVSPATSAPLARNCPAKHARLPGRGPGSRACFAGQPIFHEATVHSGGDREIPRHHHPRADRPGGLDEAPPAEQAHGSDVELVHPPRPLVGVERVRLDQPGTVGCRLLDPGVDEPFRHPEPTELPPHHEARDRPHVRIVEWLRAARRHHLRPQQRRLAGPGPDAHPGGGLVVDVGDEPGRGGPGRDLTAEELAAFVKCRRVEVLARNRESLAPAAAAVTPAGERVLDVGPRNGRGSLDSDCRHRQIVGATRVWRNP